MKATPRSFRSGITAVALFALSATALAQAGGPIFPAATYPTGPIDEVSTADLLVVGDVSGDGLPDAVVGVRHPFVAGSVYVLRGNFQGGLDSAVSYGGGFGPGTPESMAIGDVTGDGRPDLVLSTRSFFSGLVVMVLRGNAQGTLEFDAEYPTAGGVVAVGDVTGDLRADVVLVQAGQACVLAANAGGTLDAPVCYALSGSGYASVALGDVDGDLRTDVVAASANRLCFLRGNALGTLDPPTCRVTGGSYARNLALGDVTGDGRLDAVLLDTARTMACVYAGNPLGTFDSAVCYASGLSEVRSVAVGDASADGRQDVVVAGWAPALLNLAGHVCLLKGNPAGTLDAAVPYVPGYARPSSLALGDLAGDGRLEVLFGNVISNDVCVLESDGQGGLEIAAPYLRGGFGPLAVGDVTGDGRLDVVHARNSDFSVCVLAGNAQGTLEAPVCQPAGGNPISVATGEVSNDTFLDVVVSTSAGVCVLTGNALGTLDPVLCSPGGSGDLAVGDVTGDGRPDVVVSTDAGVCVHAGNALGTLDPEVCTAAPTGQVAIGDVTGDGRQDVVVASSFQPNAEVCVFAGNALGTLDAPICYSAGTPGAATGVAIGDVSGDGRPDVVVTAVSGPGGGRTCVFHGNALGTLDPAVCETPAGAPSGLALGDVNGDGILDVVEGSFTTDADGIGAGLYVGVREGGVSGGLGSLFRYGSGSNFVRAVVLGDVTGDGLPDAIVPGGSFGLNDVGVSVLENQFRALGTVSCAGVSCPCANDGVAGHGCQNSASTGGARLYGSGQASLADDTVHLFASGEMPSALTIFLQGDIAIPPTPFGDGLRCAGGALKRLYTGNASAGAISRPGSGDPSVSVRSATLGDPLSTGDLRVYQTYYRDPNTLFCPSPTGSTFNASNALSLTWL
jgi:hypothetical protein